MSPKFDYQAALDYIYSFIDYSRTRQENLAPENFDLSRMHALLARLGDPHRAYACIHVAGSKGKGSVSAFCAAVLQAAGYRAGLYTSPHLEDFCERIQISGILISEIEVASLIQEMEPHIQAVPGVTTFEITTALAFLYFARREVDIAIFEVGLGGRLDATNVILPLVSAVTSISLEHTAILGDTLAKIAREKAGIIKPGVPVVSAPQADEARQVLATEALRLEAEFMPVDRFFRYQPLMHSLDSQSFHLQSRNGKLSMELEIPLLGSHQIENAVVAFAALEIVSKSGFPIEEQHYKMGFAHTRWPGRFEILQRKPYIILDSAHNPESTHKLRLTLEEYFPGQQVVLVFGCSEDKNAADMLAELAPLCSLLIATRSMHPRAMHTQAILEQAQPLSLPSAAADDIESALQDALHRSSADGVILIAGSVFVAGAARSAWKTLHAFDQEV